jgi:hypothetical protein
MEIINAQTIIDSLMAAHAVAPATEGGNSQSGWASPKFITIRTSERGTYKIHNNKPRIMEYVAIVRKKASAFGGGLNKEKKEKKAKPSVVWNPKLLTAYKIAWEGEEYQTILNIGDELGALYFADRSGNVHIQVAPIPCPFDSRFSTVLRDDGTFTVIYIPSMTTLTSSRDVERSSYVMRPDGTSTTRAGMNKLAEQTYNYNHVRLEAALACAVDHLVDQVKMRADFIRQHALVDNRVESVNLDAFTD